METTKKITLDLIALCDQEKIEKLKLANSKFDDFNEDDEILEQMEKKTGVPWQVNEEKSDSRFLAIETIDHTKLRKLLEDANPEDEKAFVEWRMGWKNKEFEIATGK